MSTIPFFKLKLDTEGFENPRTHSGLEKSSIRELANDIEARGLLYPLLVWQNENVILGGQRRYKAIELLIEEGKAGDLEHEIPVLLYDADTIIEAQAVALADGLHRKQLSSYEIAQALAEMSGSQTEIAEQIGKSIAYVSRALKTWNTAGPTLMAAWRDEKIAYVTVKEIAKLSIDKQKAAISGSMKPKLGPKGIRDRPSIRTIKQIVEWAEDVEPSNDYEQGLIDMAQFVTEGKAPHDKRWRKYLEE